MIPVLAVAAAGAAAAAVAAGGAAAAAVVAANGAAPPATMRPAAGAGARVLGAARSPVTSVGVAEREFRVSLYRVRVRPGFVKLNVRNFGEDTHDLVVRGPHPFVRERGRIVELRAGRRGTLRVRLRREGRYAVVCTLADHEARGMRATLRVSRSAGR